jgi:HAE1 family hydrophobic/amphiphilic exporter-1
VISGLYYVLAKLPEKYKLVKMKKENPLTEEFDDNHV